MAEAASPQNLAKEGNAAYKRGDYQAAGRAFEAARLGYQAMGEELNAAEMANNSSVAYLQAGDGAAALAVVEGSEAIFAQAGDLRRQGMALGNRGAALEALERPEEAIAAYQEAAEILQQAGEDQMRAQVMQSLSMLQFQMGQQLQALASMQNGIEGVQRPSARQKMLKKLLNIPFEMGTGKKS
jgi:tetratricopeptide (TPR) repeat protein